MTKEKENLHKGHRKRVKDQFIVEGFSKATPDHKVLELLLFYSVPQKDTNELAHRLLNTFGSLSAVFDASYDELLTVKGVSEHTACLLKLVIPTSKKYLEDLSKEKFRFKCIADVSEYVAKQYIGEVNEVVRIFCFNNKNELVGEEVLSMGDLTKVNLDIKSIIQMALKYRSTGVVIAHNHPVGFAVASGDDQRATLKIKEALNYIGVKLYDHVIVANGKYLSMVSEDKYKIFFG